jgi:hypothetical protein
MTVSHNKKKCVGSLVTSKGIEQSQIELNAQSEA